MSYIKYKISMLAVCASLISPGLLNLPPNVGSLIELRRYVGEMFANPYEELF